MKWPTMDSGNSDDSNDDIPTIDFGRASPDPPQDREPEEREPPIAQTPIIHSPHIPPSPSALFQRLRTASFNPLASIRRTSFFGSNRDLAADAASFRSGNSNMRLASSESSSDDDDLSIASKMVWNQLDDSLSDEEDNHRVNGGRDTPTQDF